MIIRTGRSASSFPRAGDRALSAADLERKRFDNALMAVSQEKAERIYEAVLALEKHAVADFARLLSA